MGSRSGALVNLWEVIVIMVYGACTDSCERMRIDESAEMCRGGGFSGNPVICELVLAFPSCSASPLFSEVWDCLGVLGGVCGMWNAFVWVVFVCV
jgi:hypothetical protein